MSAELISDDEIFEGLDEIISEVDETLDRDPEVEFIPTDEAERGAKGVVRMFCTGVNWLLKFKDPRLNWNDEIIAQAEENISPALMKHGIGSGRLSQYAPEANATMFTTQLFHATYKGAQSLRAADEAERKAREAGQHSPHQPQPQQTESEPAPAPVPLLGSGLNEHIDFKEEG